MSTPLLFLEGTIGCGKSTLIRDCLMPFRAETGGLVSQRLFDDHRKVSGYRITSAEDFEINIPVPSSLDGVFRYNDPDGNIIKDPNVFETTGVSLLQNTKNKKIILLDEIGGSELLCPEFKKTLYDTLSGGLPCIGVLKPAANAAHMIRTANYPKEISIENEKLRQWMLSRGDCKILTLTSANRNEIKKEIEIFLCGIFTTD